nr:helix-turn-helix domain-containing protein [Burkholderia ubonensis]
MALGTEMVRRFNKFDCVVVSPGKPRNLCGPAIWLVKSIAGRTQVEMAAGELKETILIDEDRSALIFSSGNVDIVSDEGAWRFHLVPLFEAAKLLAFLECAVTSNTSRVQRHLSTFAGTVVDLPGDLTIWKFDRWMIRSVMEGASSTVPLFEFLRAQESYELVRFLLRERNNPQTVAKLAARYGVSEPHFRRLCRRALGRGLKRELRQWRAVQALLEVVESRESLCQVAMTHGFASSSHFSKEIKDLFGMSPCQFRRSNKESI